MIVECGILIIFLTYFPIVQTVECEVRYVQENETLIPILSQSGFFIIRNESSSQPLTIDEIKIDLLEHVHTIENEGPFEFISTVHAQSEISVFHMQICQLIVDIEKQYFITCKDGFKNYLIDNILDFNYSQSYQIHVQTTSDDICEYIFQNSKFQFNVLCFSNQYFKLLSATRNNITNTEVLFYYLNISDQIECQKNVIQQDSYIIISYQSCLHWNVYIIKNNKIIKQITYLQNTTISQLQNICYTQNILFLYSCNKYLMFNIKYNNYVFYERKMCSDKEIFMVIDNCKFLLIQNENRVVIQSMLNEVDKLFIRDALTSAYLIKDKLVLLRKSSIEVVQSLEIRQVFNYSQKSLLSFNNTNYLQGSDTKNGNILFFRLNSIYQFQNIARIQFQGKYVFQFESFNIFSQKNEPIGCEKLEIITSKQTNLIQIKTDRHLQFSQEINRNFTFLYPKRFILLNQPISLKLNDSYSNKDELDFLDYCQINSLLISNSQKIHLIEIEKTKFLLLLNSDNVIFYNCILLNQISYNIRVDLTYQISLLQDSFALLSEDKKSIYIFQFIYGNVQIGKTSKFEKKIKNIFPSSYSYIWVSFEDDEIIILDIFQLKQIELNILDKIPIEEPILYITKGQQIYLIQFHNYIYYGSSNEAHIFKISNIKILFCSLTLQQNMIFFNETSGQISKCSFINGNLIIRGNFRLNEYQLILPLEYASNSYFLVMASKLKEKYFLLIYDIRNQLAFNFIKIVNIGMIQFSLTQNKLLYIDEKQKSKIIDLEYLHINVDGKIICQNKKLILGLQFQANSLIIQNSTTVVDFILEIPHSCNYIQKQPSISPITLEIDKISIYPQNFVLGQIDYFQIKDTHSHITFNGPFILSEKYESCKQFSVNFCFGKEPEAELYFLFDVTQSRKYLINFPFALDEIKIISAKIEGQELILSYMDSQTISIELYQQQRNIFEKTQSKQLYHNYGIKLDHKISGDISQVKMTNQNYFFVINQFIHNEESNRIKDFLHIEGTKNYYVFIYETILVDHYQIKIMQLIDFELSERTTLIMNNYVLQGALQNQFYYTNSEYIKDSRLLQSIKLEQKIEIKVIILSFKKYSFVFKITIYDTSDEPTFTIIKILRFHIDQNEIEPFFWDESFFIVRSLDKAYYMYDLRGNDEIIDSICQLEMTHTEYQHLLKNSFEQQNLLIQCMQIIEGKFYFSCHIFKYNLTHYIFQDQKENIFVGQIDYQLNIENKFNFDQNITLTVVAGNKNEKIEFNIETFLYVAAENGITSRVYNSKIWITLSIIIFLLVRFFIRRKQLLQIRLNHEMNLRNL